jgi:hypothetical protein
MRSWFRAGFTYCHLLERALVLHRICQIILDKTAECQDLRKQILGLPLWHTPLSEGDFGNQEGSTRT